MDKTSFRLIVNPNYSVMNSQKSLGSEPLPMLARAVEKIGPCATRDALASLPFADALNGRTDRVRKVRRGRPKVKDIVDAGQLGVGHGPFIHEDRLSSQEGMTRPVTKKITPRTMSPMGKAVTPKRFREQFCERLRAARIAAGYEQHEFAKQLGLLPNTYAKYETRSFLPNYLIADACDILRIEIDYLYTGKRKVLPLRDVG